MDLRIKGKTALVLAAGGGLGGATAQALADEGARVVAADVNLEAAQKRVGELTGSGATAMALEWDLSDLGCIPERVSTVEAAYGPVDILVNITGGPPPTAVLGQQPADWAKYFNSMVLAIIAISDRIVPVMRDRKWGRVITSASSGIVTPIPNLGLSNVLRASLVGWSKTLAREVAADGVTSNVIVPGRIATDRIRYLDESKAKRSGASLDEVRAQSTSSIPMGRYGEPDEYGRAVAFLASDAASYITGSIMRVDGGLIPSI